MNAIRKYLPNIKPTQWILVGAGFAFGIVAFVFGVNDNLPGIVALYLSLFCIAAAWVWNLPGPKDYWIIFFLSLAAFPLGVILHNGFYALSSVTAGVPFLEGLFEFLHAFFFLVALMAAGPAALAGLIGGIVSSWRGMNHLTFRNRSIRRFKEKVTVREKTLHQLVNLARQSASGANLQPLKFILSSTPEQNQLIFPTLAWAGYLQDWPGPEQGERPSAYIIVLGDTDLGNSFQYDAGIACQSITLGAAERGLGACLIGSIKRNQLREALRIPEKFQILLVIALGEPAENIVLESVTDRTEIKYWRDDQDRHHVPKRELDELILDL
jgi:nitroreductase